MTLCALLIQSSQICLVKTTFGDDLAAREHLLLLVGLSVFLTVCLECGHVAEQLFQIDSVGSFQARRESLQIQQQCPFEKAQLSRANFDRVYR